MLKKAKAAEMKARESQTQAENANAAKSAFLFNMSHDIRTPMNALLGYNQLMKKELTDPKLLHYQRAVRQSEIFCWQLSIMYLIWLVLKVAEWNWMKAMPGLIRLWMR